MHKYFLVLMAVFVHFIVLPKISLAQTADIILTNGKIFTSDQNQLYVEALAIKGNRIIAAGSDKDIFKYAGTGTKRINLEGKTVLPGFNDAHDHLGFLFPPGLSFSYPEIPSGPDKNAALDSVAKLVKRAKPNQWVSGWIGTQILFDTSIREALDSIAPLNPVVLQIWWGHGQVVNSKALELSGLSDNIKDAIGGRYIRNSSTGKINSLLENAQVPVWNAWFGSDDKSLIKSMRAYSLLQLEAGITTVQQMSSPFGMAQSLRLFNSADLQLRIRVIAWPKTTAQGRQLNEWSTIKIEQKPLLYFSGTKYIIDGTPLEQLALIKDPYENKSNWFGELNFPVDTIRNILKEAFTTDRQLMMHITGDSTLAIILSEMEKIGNAEVWKSKRVRFEHNAIIHTVKENELKSLRDMGILVMHTPKYGHRNYLKTLFDNGILVGIAPDGTTNPCLDIMMMTTRMVDPGENISREQAVIAYTLTNAYAEFAEKEKGTLTKGMLADLVVLSDDIFTVPPGQLPAIKSVLTMVDGKVVYSINDK